ncbi:hypothetical protein N657DRAFT_670814 [Parathielavia appendiculata]|uniref:Cupin domain-containing protein n=1 Tax=Parathielavia appendiculata TaxID=2587402 RepID=A0AAN6U216_9PEZI|nr:hypothetical protein N657DRAFT_670814 [Parathielavia appendiculata]
MFSRMSLKDTSAPHGACAMPSPEDIEAALYARGYAIVFEWTEPPNAYCPPHSHADCFLYVILEGEITVCYHADYGTGYSPNVVLTYRQLDCVMIESDQLHEVWIGDQGCKFVVGKAAWKTAAPASLLRPPHLPPSSPVVPLPHRDPPAESLVVGRDRGDQQRGWDSRTGRGG